MSTQRLVGTRASLVIRSKTQFQAYKSFNSYKQIHSGPCCCQLRAGIGFQAGTTATAKMQMPPGSSCCCDSDVTACMYSLHSFSTHVCAHRSHPWPQENSNRTGSRAVAAVGSHRSTLANQLGVFGTSAADTSLQQGSSGVCGRQV